LSLWV